jgi:transcriptional regulator with XRE-family HTH domain
MTTELGNRLRALRKAKEMNQVDVAAALDVGRSTIASIETGSDLPGRDLLVRLADFYGVGLDELYVLGVNAPEDSKRAKDEDEVALLGFWRKLDKAGKSLFLLALARGRDGS